jgi:hypothetical protein
MNRTDAILSGVFALATVAGLWAIPAEVAAVNSFTSPVVVTGEDTGEPGIDVGPGGVLYINAPAGFLANLPGSASLLFRSEDGGASWVQTPNGVRDLFPGGGDSDAAVDQADGTIYFADLWLGDSTVSVSHDMGNTWVANPFGSVVVQDRQWLATPGGGRAYLATHQIPAGLVVSKSVDGGLSYPISSIAATPLDQTGCICPSGTLIAEAGGLFGLGDRVGLIYATSTGGVKFARSTNGGLTFASTVVSPASGVDTAANFPIVANAGSGHLVAVWLEITGGQTRVRFNDSADWGATWNQSRTLVGTGTSVFPWVDARGSKVAVTLYHTTAVATPDTAPESAVWFEEYLESTNGGASFSSLLTIDPTPVKTGPICTEGANCTEDRELLDFQSVVIDAAGRSNATWTRSIDNVSDTEIRFARQM